MALGAALKEARMRKKLTASEVASATRIKVQTVTALEEEDFSRIAAPIYAKGFIKLYAEFVGLNAQALVDEYVRRFVEQSSPDEPAGEEDDNPELMSVSRSAPPAPEPTAAEPAPAAPPRAESPTGRRKDELDLFREVESASSERRGGLMDDGYCESEPVAQEGLSSVVARAVDALQAFGDHVAAGCRRRWGGSGAFAVRLWDRLMQTVAARRHELAGINFKDLSARHMLALLGVLVLLVLVVSSLSRCVRGPQDAAGSAADRPLPVAAEPADVFLD